MRSAAWSLEKLLSFGFEKPLSFGRLGTGSLADAALVQVGWWACVLGAARGLPLLGPTVVAALLAVQTLGLPALERRRVWRGILLLGVAGTIVDSLQGGLGLLSFHGAPVAWLAPLWITALWCHLAIVVPAFAPLRSRPLVAGLLGAVGGPLAYAGGARLGAAELHPETWFSLAVLAAVWAVAFPVMIRALVPAEGAER